MLERHRNDNSNYKPTLFQTLNLDVSIQSKGKLGILLMKRVNEGYVVCNVKHYSPLSGTLEKGDLITNWDNTHLGTVSTSDLANIVEKSQTDGFFRLRVKRGIRSASGSATPIGKNSSDNTPANKLGPFQKDIQSETAKNFSGNIEQQSKNKRRLEETACHLKTVEKGATEVTESANKKRALESDVMANHTNQSKTLLPTQALAEQLKTLAMPKFVVDEKEMKKAAETTNNKPTLESDTTAEHTDRSKALLLANGKELVLTELKTPAGPKSVSDGKEIKKVIDRTNNKPSLESAVVNKHPKQSITPLLVAQGKDQIPIEQSKIPSIFKFVVDDNEMKKAAERTNNKPTLESDTTAAEHTNRNKTLLLANGKELALTELKTPPIFKSVADGKEMKTSTESMNNKPILESDTTAEHTNRSKTLLLAQDKEQKTKEATKTVDKHDGHLGGMTRTSKSKANNAIKSTFQKDTPKDGDEMIIQTSENRFANAKISPGQKLGIFLKRNNKTFNISVENVLASSPFYSKLEFGDIITHFNEVNLKNKSIQEIKEMFQSYPGYRLRIGFQRFKKNLQRESPCLKNLEEVNHEARNVDVPLGKMTLGLQFQRMPYGMLVLSVSQASCLRGMLDKGDVITHVNSTSIMNDTIQEFSQKVVQSQECRLSVTGVANSFKSSSDETKKPSDIFEIKRRAAASSSKGSKAAQKADSTKSHDPAKNDISVSAIDTAQLTDEQISSLPYVYAFIVDDERSMQKAEKRNTRLMKHWKNNTKDTPSKNASSHKPSSRVKNIPVFIGPSKDYKGWTEEVHLKHGSNQRYKYWFSPIKKYKFRTKKGIDSFLDALTKTGGDEDQAFLLIKNELK